MFTDVVGYTALSSRDEKTALTLLEQYRSLLMEIFQRHEGRVVKTMGDGFLVEFASAVEAVDCAVEAQKDIGRLNATRPEELRTLMRIGIHVGDVVHADGDVLGDAVNVASRVEPVAEPGGICVTRQVVDHVRGKVEWEMVPLGKKELKNLPEPVEVFAVESTQALGMFRVAPNSARRLAILPFANLSPDPNDRYFADGMTEELISTVSNIGELSVISRTSAMKYRDSSLSAKQIGRELEVGAILEGSVRKAGNRVRISAKLIEVEADRYVWSESYDRDLTDILGVQGEIAQQVAQGLRVRLLESEKEKLEAKPTESAHGYNLYLKGRFYWNERTEEGVRRAIRYFQEAVETDPRFAKAYTGLADCYLILSDYGWMAPADAGRLAKENALKALALDEGLAEAHASLGLVNSSHLWNFAEGERQYKRSIELNPSYVTAYHWYSVLLAFHMRFQESFEMIKRASELDPVSIVIRQSVGVALLNLKRYDEAMDMYRLVEDESPELPSVHYWKSVTFLIQGMDQEAIEEARKEMRSNSYDAGARLDLAFVLSETGRKEEARKILDEVLPKETYFSPCSVAAVLLSLGDSESAAKWFEKAYENRDTSLLYFRFVPTFAKFRSDEKWKEIEARIGFGPLAS